MAGWHFVFTGHYATRRLHECPAHNEQATKKSGDGGVVRLVGKKVYENSR